MLRILKNLKIGRTNHMISQQIMEIQAFWNETGPCQLVVSLKNPRKPQYQSNIISKYMLHEKCFEFHYLALTTCFGKTRIYQMVSCRSIQVIVLARTLYLIHKVFVSDETLSTKKIPEKIDFRKVLLSSKSTNVEVI